MRVYIPDREILKVTSCVYSGGAHGKMDSFAAGNDHRPVRT